MAIVPPGLQIPPGDFKAYLFDCDGTIVDSMPLHYIAWKTALGEWGCSFDEQLFYAWGGLPAAEVISTLSAQQGLDLPVALIAERKEELYYELLPQLKAVPEVLAQIEASSGTVPFAVVSGSTRESVTRSLEILGILDKFDVLVCAGEYANSKPHPEPFLTAARLLAVPPEACLVFEDTDLGIQAAKSAGMGWVKVLQPWERPK